MNVWRLNRGHSARLALAGAVAGACALIASPAPALANVFSCTAQEVAVYPGSRIHIRCNPGDGAIAFFALSVANPDASRVLSLAAVAARRPLSILYDPNDLSGAAIGCLNADCRLIQAVFLERCSADLVGAPGCPEAVTTYHYDNNRTGWNSNESILTPANVTPNGFGLIATADLDDDNDQVDAQPLIVPNQTIQGIGVRAVAYVVTENNSVYGIDAFSGAKLIKVNLGAPVPRPLNCENNGPAVGINGTPTIDIDSRTLYVVSYVMVGSSPTHQLHALDLATLQDKPGSPVTIAASNTLQDGSTDKFDSSVQRQRAALLQANGNVYAGFGAYCDFQALHSRGWVLGWRRSSLTPLGHNELLNKAVTAPSSFNCYFHAPWTNNHPCFLSSVWMSGFGLASDTQGNLFFTTGNTAEGIYNSTTNLAESLVKLSPDLSTVVDFFTPANVNALDAGDTDFGSGGALVLPDQPGPVPNLAVAAGKDGNLFIVNRDTGHMGEFHNPDVSASVPIDGCWCGPSYFKGADGVGRVVSSGGSQIKQWTVKTANTPALTLEASAPLEHSDQDPGFFTSISSNGTAANTTIIWAVDRPVGNDNHVTLYAFDATPSGGALKQEATSSFESSGWRRRSA